jgi:hypothetical protein
MISSKLIVEADSFSIDKRAREFNRSWLVVDLCHVFSEFPKLLKDLSAFATVTEIVQNIPRLIHMLTKINNH